LPLGNSGVASSFGAAGPKFKLLFGSAVTKPFGQPPAAHELFGYAVHHLLRARFCIERGRYWHAEYWISSARDYALMLACLRLGLQTAHGRGYDDLPPDEENVAEVIIGKQRNGPIETIKLVFLPQFARFENIADQYRRPL
jgi:hypothetical protein